MNSGKSKAWIGIDLGATKVAVGKISSGVLVKDERVRIIQDSEDPMDVVHQMMDLVKKIFGEDISGIGIGVPGLVDRSKGIVYDVLNIPNWKEIPLKSIFEKAFGVPVHVDNDANCFAMGEYSYGKYAGSNDFVGITLGTGMGSGIIKNGALLPDAHGCSGEFGTMPYLDGIYENYTSGMFFIKKYGMNGEEAARKAMSGDFQAKQASSWQWIHPCLFWEDRWPGPGHSLKPPCGSRFRIFLFLQFWKTSGLSFQKPNTLP
jgi:glucokinase